MYEQFVLQYPSQIRQFIEIFFFYLASSSQVFQDDLSALQIF